MRKLWDKNVVRQHPHQMSIFHVCFGWADAATAACIAQCVRSPQLSNWSSWAHRIRAFKFFYWCQNSSTTKPIRVRWFVVSFALHANDNQAKTHIHEENSNTNIETPLRLLNWVLKCEAHQSHRAKEITKGMRPNKALQQRNHTRERKKRLVECCVFVNICLRSIAIKHIIFSISWCPHRFAQSFFFLAPSLSIRLLLFCAMIEPTGTQCTEKGTEQRRKKNETLYGIQRWIGQTHRSKRIERRKKII